MADVESLELHRIGKKLDKLTEQMAAGNRARAQLLKDGYDLIDPNGGVCECDKAHPCEAGRCRVMDRKMEQWDAWLAEAESSHAEVLASIAYLEGRLTHEEYEWIGGACSQ